MRPSLCRFSVSSSSPGLLSCISPLCLIPFHLVPERHRLIPHILNITSLLGFPLLTWGLITLQIWPTAMGIFLITGAELWCLDRMVVLYEYMASTDRQLAYRGPVGVADPQSAGMVNEPSSSAPREAERSSQ